MLGVAVQALLLLLPGGAAGAASVQDVPDWEKKIVQRIEIDGLVRQNEATIKRLLSLKEGGEVTRALIDKTYTELNEMRWFRRIHDIPAPRPAPDNPAQVIVTIRVEEYLRVVDVKLPPETPFKKEDLRADLKIVRGDMFEPAYLKHDRALIRDRYLREGYAHVEVREDLETTADGVSVRWNVQEGPEVIVEEIVFTGNHSIDDSTLKRAMLHEEKERLFGVPIFPVTGWHPFVERNVREDVERIKLWYRTQGWRDIHFGNRVFLKDMIFNEDRTRVTLHYHVDEGERYFIRSIRFELDPSSRGIFTEEELRQWVDSTPGTPYLEKTATDDADRISRRYGERAYINAEVIAEPTYDEETPEVDLVFRIKENEKVYIGRITFEGRDRFPGENRGNVRSREDIFRRELTRVGFVPGEEYNSVSLERAITRLHDRGWVAPRQADGIRVHTEEGDTPELRDVVIDLKEAQTGSLRFAAGYSSAFGVLGVLQFEQRNFDISDLPEGVGDLFSGKAFVGGGQNLRIRLAPAARQQSYDISFREPYLFGYDVGLGLRGYSTNTVRESWDELQRGIRISFDKRYDPFGIQISLATYTTEVDDVESGAPTVIQRLRGSNDIFSITPLIYFDTRDSFLFPTEGARFSASYEYAGQVLPGEFDFHKIITDGQIHFPVIDPVSKAGNRMRHVLSLQGTFRWVHGDRRTDEIPVFERFFAGGRGSIRGFDFRGVGPQEFGDPVGGEAYVFGSTEYSFPLFVEILRGAFFYDIANLSRKVEHLEHDTWRQSVGFGIRFIVPQLGGIPVSLDFGFPFRKDDDDERQTITFDIGALF